MTSQTDPIGERLLRLALNHGAQLLEVRSKAARTMGVDVSAVGMVLLGDEEGFTMCGAPIAETLALAVTYQLDASAGAPGFWPCVVVDRGEGCVCWLRQQAPGAIAGVA